MATEWFYLGINLASVSIPLGLSFSHKFGKIYRHWGSIGKSIFITMLFFLLWDIPFNYWEVWGFTPQYLLKYYFLGLPLEEYLFFVCIPYACLFTYIQFKNFNFQFFTFKSSLYLTYGFTIITFSLICFFFEKAYTFMISISILIFLLIYHVKLKTDLSYFYTTYFIVIIPFILVNGFLTGMATNTPIVWYNNSENLGLRIITIPVEDFLYYFLMFIINITLYDHYKNKTLAR